jgi:hypothetical protein
MADRAGTSDDWIAVPAPTGGCWFLAQQQAALLVLAPPGVALGGDTFPERWRAITLHVACGLSTLDVLELDLQPVPLRTAEVITLLGAHREPLVRSLASAQLDASEGWWRPAPGDPIDDARAREAFMRLRGLRTDLAEAFPDEHWHHVEAQPPAVGAYVPNAPDTWIHPGAFTASTTGYPSSLRSDLTPHTLWEIMRTAVHRSVARRCAGWSRRERHGLRAVVFRREPTVNALPERAAPQARDEPHGTTRSERDRRAVAARQ